MAAAITKHLPEVKIELVEGGRGDFIVTVNGKRIWDKRGADGGFPPPEEIISRLPAG